MSYGGGSGGGEGEGDDSYSNSVSDSQSRAFLRLHLTGSTIFSCLDFYCLTDYCPNQVVYDCP